MYIYDAVVDPKFHSSFALQIPPVFKIKALIAVLLRAIY